MATTYEPIATTTLGSAAASITFSSIASTYTDLRVVLVAKGDAGSDGNYVNYQYNSDTGSNYSLTYLLGNGTTASSGRGTSYNYIPFDSPLVNNKLTFFSADIFSYAGSTNKTSLNTTSNDQNGSGDVGRNVGLWRNTSAITSIKLYPAAGNFNTGTTATLYGIKNA